MKQEKSISLAQRILIATKLINLELNETAFYKFVEAVEGKLNTSMSPWVLGESPSKTRCMTTKPKVHGSYIEGRIYKQGKLERIKTGHKAQINWIY
jgi:hypothetical protein